MSRYSRLGLVIVFTTVLSLLTVGTTVAGSSAGDASDYVTALSSGWVQINDGQSHWYRFHTDAATSDGGYTHLLVELSAEPQGSATFAVWTPEGLAASQAGNRAAAPVGNGAQQTYKDGNGNNVALNHGDLLWVNASSAAQDYIVGVQPASSSPSRYLLRISGPYVSFSDAGMAASGWSAASVQTLSGILGGPQQVNVSQSLRPSRSLPPMQLANGAAPGSAFVPDGLIRTLPVGQQHWYAFKHVGPGAASSGTTISIVLNASPQGSATFSVWTPAEVQALLAGDTTNAEPVGRGSLHPVNGDSSVDRFGGSPEWAGKFNQSGTYYVQVIQTGNAPSSYSLAVSSSSKPK